MASKKNYKKLARAKLLRVSRDGKSAKVVKTITLYEAKYPMKPRLYYFRGTGKRVRVYVTSGSFYNLSKGRYVRRAGRGDD